MSRSTWYLCLECDVAVQAGEACSIANALKTTHTPDGEVHSPECGSCGECDDELKVRYVARS